jgi:GrpB-like predicted nucleotidyltransferase (UPF0157 family)
MNRPKPFPVIIEPYSFKWPLQFEEEKARLLQAIAPFVICIEHIGSTAVPGLPAKPVIDILIGVHSLEDASRFLPPLETLGYRYISELEKEIPERRYLQKVSANAHTHHLHIAEPDSQFFIDHLRFRDLLRTHPDLAGKYAKLKYELAKRYRYDREAYTDAKSDFIEKALLIPKG